MSPSQPLLAVVDLETTGLFPFRHDRIVEVAAVVVRPNGQVEREFVSLVNPVRDIGPTSIHGLTTDDLLHAPEFRDIVPLLVDALEGCVAIAGHNIRFDQQFLIKEFARLESTFPVCECICTLRLSGGGRLADCCDECGIQFDGEAHHALHDARATAQLLSRLLSSSPDDMRNVVGLAPISWPRFQGTSARAVTRDESRRKKSEPPTFLQRLLNRMHDRAAPIATDGAVMAYFALLDRVLEDRRVDDSEGDALFEMATIWGLTKDQIRTVHRDYLKQLARAAVADGKVTDSERRDLEKVSQLLGQDLPGLDKMLQEAESKFASVKLNAQAGATSVSELTGQSVCFTGELQCRLNGELITRELAEDLVTKAGLVVMSSVTKKLNILVVADPNTQSGKAKKARSYGTRIVCEAVFWKNLGIEVE